jgi:ribosomal protein S14
MTPHGLIDVAELRALQEQELDPILPTHAEAVTYAHQIIERLGGYTGLDHYDTVPAGTCAECEHHAETRYLLTIFTLCRACLRRRIRAAAKLAAEQPPAAHEQAA